MGKHNIHVITPATTSIKKEPVPTISLGKVGKIFISEDLKKQIDFLHQKVGNFEWSGVLIYKHTGGDIKDLKNLEFHATNMFLMDIGSGAYTEFNYNEQIVAIYDVMPEAMESATGLIHTHHNMGAFHSGTDLSELQDNAGVYNYYVSLVVDFKETYVCKIAFPATVVVNESKHNISTIRNTDGTIIPFEEKSEKKEEKIVHYLGDLDVVLESTPVEIPKWIADRYDEVKKAKEKPIYSNVIRYNSADYGRSAIGFGREGGGYASSVPSYRQPTLGAEFQREDNISDFEEYTATSFKDAREFDKDKDKDIKLFVNAIVFGDSTAKLDTVKGIVNLNLLEETEFKMYMEIVDTNIEAFHDNVYGSKDTRFLRHLREAVQRLSAYVNAKRPANIDKLIEFLDDYGTPAT